LVDSLYVPKPSLKTHIAFRYFAPERTIKIDKAVHFRDSGEGNYWHFLNDIVGGRLRMLEEHGVDETIPIVISEGLFSKPFFQAVLRRTRLGRRTFVLQGNELVQSEGIYYFETSRHSRKMIEFIWNFLGVPDSNVKNNRRIFLARDVRAGRSIINMDEVEAVLERFDFEMVDTSQMSLDEQIEVFGGARQVVGVHGAGLTNMLFRKKADLNLLEIFPPMSSYSSPKLAPPPLHYFWLARALDFKYGLMFGEADVVGDYRSPFTVNVAELSKKIAEMLDR
jgi:capsular polysaccharide biosynthesis protein